MLSLPPGTPLIDLWIDVQTATTDDLKLEAIDLALRIEAAETDARGLRLRFGAVLMELKGRERGEGRRWLDFVEGNLRLEERQVRRYLKLAKNRTRVSELPPGLSMREEIKILSDEDREARRIALKEELIARGEAVDLPVVQGDTDYTLALVEGDCGDLPVDAEQVDLIVTSPPYNLGKAYGATSDRLDYEREYLATVVGWAAEMVRVLAWGGRLAIVLPLDTFDEGADQHRAVYADWVLELQNAGLVYQHTIVWDEGTITKTTARGSVDSPSAPHVIARVEMIAVFSRGAWNLGRNRDPHNLSHEQWLAWTNGVWTIPGERQALHPAAFPEALADRLLRLYSFRGDTVLDPFLGSGTTALAAVKLGRNVIGVDTDPAMVALARGRLATYLREETP
jgi:site-specific DNA-methyltransferase (adenine-specific)